ncbi:MAG: FAD-binding and (Fe-S)-binding domain-containing protein [Actinomycetota bacterium]
MSGSQTIDVRGLERDLSRAIEGEVRFDAGSRALYATDASNFRQPPIGVVIPRTIEDVVETHRVCREHAAPILSRGCGTSLSGETVNYAVVIDHSKYLHAILEIDPDRRIARVQPGAINEQVNQATGRHGLVFGPDPSTHEYCTIGGNVGNNSCGVHSVQARMAGTGSRTSDNTAELEVLTYDGERMRVGPTTDEQLEAIIAADGRRGQIYRDLRDLRDRYAPLIRERFVDIPRRVSGYNIDELLPEKGFNVARALVGTEGTCVTVLEASLLLVPDPPAKSLLVLGYDDIFAVADHVVEIMAARPIGCEAIDFVLFHNQQQLHIHPEDLKQLPDGRAWVLVEFGGETKEEADAKAHQLFSKLKKDDTPPRDLRVFDDPAEEAKLWEVREAGLAATAFPPDGKDHWPGWEDSAVPPERMGDYLRDLKSLYDRYGYRGAMYGHLGDGCVHSRISFDLRTAGGVKQYRSFLEEAADLVVSYGGSLSGEHGDGQQRAELLPRMFGEELVDAFREFKRIWDPDWKMNPGKVVDPYRLDEDLKLGPESNPWRPSVRFAYREDGGDFAHAALRCVGVGKCRKPDGVDVMCPSFIVTREEKHTTRGRARLLFEMLEGDIVTDRWRSREVEEALDLCLSCKGCTSDCPVNVDMPTYKAEFLHHRYERRIRPRHAYALGFIDKAARLGSRMPGLANVVLHAPGLSWLVKRAAGIAPGRAAPSFAPLTLQAWFARRGEGNPSGRRVVVFPDTFNNTFHTDVGVAAVEAIEAAGWHVVMPQVPICCGRPLYDYGFLDAAEGYLRRVLDVLRDDIRAGTPIVGIEPSCLAVFKDELVKLLPNDDDAARLSKQVYHFAEFFREFHIDPPKLHREALVWGHCHQKATGGIGPEIEVLQRMGVEVHEAKGGCCGLAGSWGFEREHHELSMRIGDHALLPAVRDAKLDELVVADGFSCKTQIEQGGTGRRALHLAQVMRMARERGPSGTPAGAGRPEDPYQGRRPPAPLSLKIARAGLGAALLATVGSVAAALVRRRR